MMISRAEMGKVLEVYLDKIKRGEKPVSHTVFQSSTDQITLSPRAHDVSKVRALIKQGVTSPERQERVQLLKEQIRKGEYQVSGREVAAKIIQRSLTDRLQ